ncbi:DUF885 domain-containing protein [uncultured Brevundimonas sp.]|uniref:DUF885 domain-containing protein n=1 Tax=uncultured Brevundimonas sp. TaxID=213418 RepID=UPI0030EDD8ED|tara:strand:+ start:96941 stop:98785 length:1845 start_codon:yes stop_codon:yes gene_type:complete
MRRILISSASVLLLTACAGIPAPVAPTGTPVAVIPAQSEDARLDAFFDQAFREQIALSPQSMTALGIKTDYDRLNDYTPAADARSLALAEAQLARMKADFRFDALSPQSQLSWKLFEESVERQMSSARWRDHDYIFAANGNPATSLPVFLINSHRIDSPDDARAYIARLVEVERVLGEISADVERRAAEGFVSPAFVFPITLTDTRNVISGAPFDGGPDNPVWADFQKKVAALDITDAEKTALLSAARTALTGPFKRGYDTVLATIERIQPLATSNDGVWRLPDGDAYYAERVRQSTTTDLTPDQIHEIGLSEVARIQAEMETIKTRVGFTGSLQDFFAYIKSDPRFQYPNTTEGREAYLVDARAAVADAMRVAPQWFHTLPRAALEVRAVEAWRQETASVAFYNRPAPDGSRPGIYYVNLADMTQVLKPQVEAISYHEGAPGHHFQIAYAQEIEGLPRFRRFGGYGAFSEGWGLYSERLGKEMGFYQDPYADFGRLSLEIWRAARLVTDTGLHAKHWSREQAIAYFQQNTLVSERDIVKEVERYITNPGQATSYKIGQLKILELRARARQALGDRFDIRDFHTVVLGGGSVPLDVLEGQIDAWIAAGGGRPTG